MKTKTLLLNALVALILVACQKENSGMLNLTIEGMGSDTKMAVNGNVSYWAEGDEVLINGNLVTINPPNESGNTATTSVEVNSADAYYGVYPAGICSGNIGASCTLSLPATYTYATTTRQGHTYQNLQSPMVGYTTGSSMQFKHVTGAINVQVVNYYGFTIAVDNIVVISDKYKLNGSVPVDDMTNLNVDAQTSSNDAEKRVEMCFNGSTSLHVFAGDSAIVQVPVLPVGNDNHFTVIVSIHKVDQNAVATTFEKTQNAGGELSRAKVGYARFTTPGLFSVSDSKRVVISQGNLKYSNGIWSFHTTQDGMCFTSNGDVSSSYNAAGTFDLFGWGTSGYHNNEDTYNTNYTPFSTSNASNYSATSNYKGYGPSTTMSSPNLTESSANYDWGVYNSISNGGNIVGRWRVFSKDEWDYIINTRTTSYTSGGTENVRFTKAYLFNSVHGIIIFPDDYVHPSGVSEPYNFGINNTNAAAWSSNTYSTDDWAKMEAAGAVFLPASGTRDGVNVSNTNSIGRYWTSIYNNASVSYEFYLNSGNAKTETNTRSYGYSVRLVRDVN